MIDELKVSGHRSTQRKIAKTPDDEAALTADITALALQCGRYGYRRITAMLHQAGWIVNLKRVERIWRREGLRVPHRQPKRGRLWLNDSSCIRLRPEYPNHVWSYDFVADRTHNGRKIRMFNVIDEFTRECIAIRVERRLKARQCHRRTFHLFILRGVPTHIHSDNGPEFIAKALREWIAAVGAKTAYIMPGSPWENGYCESFNSKLRDELLNGEIFYTLKEAKIVIENWRRHYNTVRRTHRWATSHRYPKRPFALARTDRLQHRQWQAGRACTNIPTGLPHGGRPQDKDESALARFLGQKFVSHAIDPSQFLCPEGPNPSSGSQPLPSDLHVELRLHLPRCALINDRKEAPRWAIP